MRPVLRRLLFGGSAVAGGSLAASYLTGQFPAGADVAQSGTSDYLRLYLPAGTSHVFWAHAGTSTQPSLSGSPTYHQITVDGLEADAVTALFAQAIVNAGSPTPLWTISGYTQQFAPTNTVAPSIDNTSPTVGDTINAIHGTYTGTPTSYSIQHIVNGSNSGSPTASTAWDTTGLSALDVLTFTETATNSVGTSSPAVTSSNSATLVAPSGFLPSDISGLKIWLKADALSLSDGDPVASWTDSSGNANHAVQATGGQKPTFKTGIINSKPVIRFDGSDDSLSATALSVTEATTFIVLKPSGAGTDWNALETNPAASDYWRYGGNGGGYFGLFRSARVETYPTVVPDTGTHLITVLSSASTYNVWTDGTSQGAQAAGFSTGSVLTIGAYNPGGGGRTFPGDIAEIIIYDSALSPTDRASVETYLRSSGRWNF